MTARERWIGRATFYLLWTVGAFVLLIAASGAPNHAGRVARQDEIPSTAVLIPPVEYDAPTTTTTTAPPPTTSTTAAPLRTTTTAKASRSSTAPRATVAPRINRALNWPALRQCESGGNYADKDSRTYRGAYQFTFKTWASVGGSGDPADAPPAEQDMRAQILYDRDGPGQWPVCGRKL